MAGRTYHHDVARRGWSEGSIYRTSSGKWRVAVSLGFDPFGRRIRKEWQVRSEAAAERKLREIRARLGSGLPAQESRVTVAAYAEEWLTAVKPSVRPTTFSFYSTLAKLHLDEVAHLPMASLAPSDIRRLIAKRLDEGYSSRTVRGVVDVLRMILKQAVGDGVLSRNVAELVQLPKLEQAEPRHFTVDEARRFLAAAAGDELHSFFTTALFTGLRRGELLALTWRDVDLERAVLMVRRSKTAAGVRVIPLASDALESLAALDKRPGPIWPVSPWVVSRRMTALCETAGLERLGLHGLRHSTASLLLDEGVDWETIKQIMGHTRMTQTAHYARASVEVKREAVERIGRAVR